MIAFGNLLCVLTMVAVAQSPDPDNEERGRQLFSEIVAFTFDGTVATHEAYSDLRSELQSIGRDAIGPALEALNSQQTRARFLAINLLGDIGDRRAIAPLQEIVQEGIDPARTYAFEALANIGGRDAYEFLLEHYKTIPWDIPGPDLRRHNNILAFQIGENEPALLRETLLENYESLNTSHKHMEQRLTCIAIVGLGKHGDATDILRIVEVIQKTESVDTFRTAIDVLLERDAYRGFQLLHAIASNDLEPQHFRKIASNKLEILKHDQQGAP